MGFWVPEMRVVLDNKVDHAALEKMGYANSGHCTDIMARLAHHWVVSIRSLAEGVANLSKAGYTENFSPDNALAKMNPVRSTFIHRIFPERPKPRSQAALILPMPVTVQYARVKPIVTQKIPVHGPYNSSPR